MSETTPPTPAPAPAPAPAPEPEPAKQFEAITSQDQLDKIVGRRLASEKAKYADYEDVKRKAAEFDKVAEAQKTAEQKLTDQATAEKTRADQAEASAMRLQVALDKGLTASQAKRLVGSTRDELEADAAELLADFGKNEPSNKGPARRPTENVRGGNDPTSSGPEPSIDDIVKAIPRR